MSFIIETKLKRPNLPGKLIPRVGLMDQLDKVLTRKLLVLSAPAGYGKTTLLCQWIQRTNLSIAWFSSGKKDSDTTRFLAYFVSAIQRVQSNIGNTSLKLLQGQSNQAQVENILDSLINDITDVKDDIVLVIDDFHLIDSQQVCRCISYLLAHLPVQMHLIVATRSDPALMLARLRSQDQMTELRASDLCFDIGETSLFLNQVMCLNLSDTDIEKLDVRIEGWAAGLQMAAISMGKREDRSGFVNAFSGSNKYIMDYLIEEVLADQTDQMQEFLIQTSILDQMNVSLCNAITCQTDSREALNHLERSNLFVIPLDEQRGWYRYHHLFAELLQKRLRHSLPDRVKALHSRASTAYETQSMMIPAVDHALKAEDFERAENLISRIAEHLWFHGEHGTLLGWTAALPKNRSPTNPELYAILAKCVSLDGRFEEAESYLYTVESSAFGNWAHLDGMASAVHAYISNYRGDMDAAATYGDRALKTLDDQHAIWRCLAGLAMGDVHVQRGSLVPAIDAYEEAIRCGVIAGDHYTTSLARHRLVVMHQRRGKLQKAYRLIKAYLSEKNFLNYQSGSLNLISGELFYEWNHLEESAKQIEKSIQRCLYQHHAAAIPYCLMMLARIRMALGDFQGASEKTRESMERLTHLDIPPWVESFVLAWKARYHLLRGEIDAAEETLRSRHLSLDGAFTYTDVSDYLVFARLLCDRGNTKQALALLERLNDHLISIGWINLALETRLVMSLSLQQCGRLDEALNVLVSVLEVAEPEGYLRIFLDEGEPMVGLLKSGQRAGIRHDYIEKILCVMEHNNIREKGETKQNPAALLQEPLSDREMEVLRLLATHLSSTEIASELFISANTARTHIKNIYSKLHVHNRAASIQAARQLHLI